MIELIITFISGMGCGAAVTIILAVLSDIYSYRTKPVKKKGVLKL